MENILLLDLCMDIFLKEFLRLREVDLFLCLGVSLKFWKDVFLECSLGFIKLFWKYKLGVFLRLEEFRMEWRDELIPLAKLVWNEPLPLDIFEILDLSLLNFLGFSCFLVVLFTLILV